MANGKEGLTITELQEVQKEHDVLSHPDLEAMDVKRQIAHTVFHLNKVLGHLGNWLEKSDHGDQEEADQLEAELKAKWVPDLLVYTLKLGNLFGIKVIEGYWQRIMEDRHKQKAKSTRRAANIAIAAKLAKK